MSKLIVVSHKLPVSVEKTNNCLNYSVSSGGLTAGLSSAGKKQKMVWMGYPGITSEEISKADENNIKQTLNNDYGSIPVFLDSYELENYYGGFSNKTLWPLFHYFDVYTTYKDEYWEAYKNVNIKFCNEILKIIEKDDLLWIHDYHLLLLPNLIRNKIINVKIGLFLHIPFPSYEIFRQLPYRKELLEGLLGANLIGFHTYSYLSHFLNSVYKICDLDNTFGTIKTENLIVKSDVFSMGIDYEKFSSIKDSNIKKEISELRKIIGKNKVIISIDRLDFTKGLIQRLEAIELFFDKYLDYKEKVIIILIAVPTRIDIDLYANLKKQVDENIGRINGKFATLKWSPILYIYKNIPFSTLMAIYTLADVALITPLRDGLNLVAKEFVAACENKNGVLILSEMAGVSEELGEAITVNPNNINEISDSINIALTMTVKEQIYRLKSMQKRLKRNDIFKWASDFIDKLKSEDQQEILLTKLHPETESLIIDLHHKSNNRIIFLDFNGTIVPAFDKSENIKPDKELMTILDNLITNKNKIVIVSGRTKKFLSEYFAEINITLIAEYGAWIMESKNNWEKLTDMNTDWKQSIIPILEVYVDRTPNTFIEEKDYSLVWNYRKSDSELVKMRLHELKTALRESISNLGLGLVDGEKIIEIRSFEINKVNAIKKLCSPINDFTLAIGDDKNDEDLFEFINTFGTTIKVGLTPSKAKYYLKNYVSVRQFLTKLV